MIVLFSIASIIMVLYVIYFLMPKNRQEIASYTTTFQTATRWNASIALVVASKLFDELAVSITALTMVALMPVVNVVNIMMMIKLLSDKKMPLIQTIVKVIQNPIIIGCLLGALLSILPIEIWPPINSGLKILGDASIGTILLSVGAGLTMAGFSNRRKHVFISSVLKLILMPMFVLTYGLLFKLDAYYLVIAIVIVAMPTAMNGYVIAKEMGGDAPLYASTGTIQTLLSLLTVPLWAILAERIVTLLQP